jgi:TRAP transporter TAXI family solute receptor
MDLSGRLSRSRARRHVAAALAVAAWSTTACRPAARASPERQTLRIATAFAPLSQPLMAEYARRLPELDIKPTAIADSPGVIAAIEDGSVDLAVALADVAYAAYWGTSNGAAPPSSRIRGVSLLQPLPEYILVRANSGIRQVSDLRGRTVAVGPPNSSTSTLGRLVLEAFDVNPVTVRVMSTRAEAAAGLKDGSLDAIFLPGYVYPDEVTYSAIREGAYLIPVAGPPADRLRREHPFVRVATIPREVYPGQDRILPTVGIDMVVLCRRDLDDAIVYQLTAQLFSAYPRLSGVEASLRFLNFDEAPATPIPLHPGAARYFRERELSR